MGTHPGLPDKGRGPEECSWAGQVRSRGKSVTPTSELKLQVRGHRQSLPSPSEGEKSSTWVSVRGHTVTCCHTLLTKV